MVENLTLQGVGVLVSKTYPLGKSEPLETAMIEMEFLPPNTTVNIYDKQLPIMILKGTIPD
jgi:hypothetical protein